MRRGTGLRPRPSTSGVITLRVPHHRARKCFHTLVATTILMHIIMHGRGQICSPTTRGAYTNIPSHSPQHLWDWLQPHLHTILYWAPLSICFLLPVLQRNGLLSTGTISPLKLLQVNPNPTWDAAACCLGRSAQYLLQHMPWVLPQTLKISFLI